MDHQAEPNRIAVPFRPSRIRLLAAILAIVAAGVGIGLALWGLRGSSSSPGQLDGKFTVYVRPADRSVEFVSVDSPTALPVQSGGAMCLEVQLNQPAFTYLLWLNCQGAVTPLYPWNNEKIEVREISQPAPVRRASNRILSPLLPHFWTFGDGQGMETVLFLARRTPLPATVNFPALLGTLPPLAPAQRPNELVVWSVDGGSKTVSTIGPRSRDGESEAQAAEEPLKQMMLRLANEFELVRAVRFAHGSPPDSH